MKNKRKLTAKFTEKKDTDGRMEKRTKCYTRFYKQKRIVRSAAFAAPCRNVQGLTVADLDLETDVLQLLPEGGYGAGRPQILGITRRASPTL